jgi:hypothetical protein
MQGDIKVVARNKNNYYEFTLHRNLTILRGNSGSGKTKLFELIADYNRFGKSSDAKVSCNCPVIAYDGRNWQRDISEIENSIVIVDEENSQFINSVEFARTIKGTSNYYLLITRNYLPQLPYSVEEIYELSGKGKNKKFVKAYASSDFMYTRKPIKEYDFVPEIVITEDSKAGYQYWKHICGQHSVECMTAESKTSVYKTFSEHEGKKVLVIADGAAFGPEMERLVLKQENSNKKLAICLPESFEWLLLSSGILERSDVVGNIDFGNVRNLRLEIDSSVYFSWEQYFTELLERITKDSRYCKYSKAKLPDFYTENSNVAKVLNLLKRIKFKNDSNEDTTK